MNLIYQMQYKFVNLRQKKSQKMTSITNESAQALHDRLRKANNPVIVTHMKPDGDAIGSSVGMYHVLDEVYHKKSSIAIANTIPSYLDFLADESVSKDIYIYEERAEQTRRIILESDLIICLDFNAFHRTDTLCVLLEESTADKILIDHHLSPDSEKFVLVFSVPQMSSTCELEYHILKSLPCIDGNVSALPHKTCTALMTGMTTDTNNFANSVIPSTLMMASELIAAGVDRNMILSNLYNRFKESRLRLQGHILKDLMKITPDGVAYMVLDKQTLKEYDVQEGDTEGFVNIPLSIDKVRMSIFIKEDDSYARVSIRSKEGTSANMCSRLHFNGGGHENAAGGRLYMPKDIADITQAAEYIERHTHIFMNNE